MFISEIFHWNENLRCNIGSYINCPPFGGINKHTERPTIGSSRILVMTIQLSETVIMAHGNLATSKISISDFNNVTITNDLLICHCTTSLAANSPQLETIRAKMNVLFLWEFLYGWV